MNQPTKELVQPMYPSVFEYMVHRLVCRPQLTESSVSSTSSLPPTRCCSLFLFVFYFARSSDFLAAWPWLFIMATSEEEWRLTATTTSIKAVTSTPSLRSSPHAYMPESMIDPFFSRQSSIFRDQGMECIILGGY